MFTAQKVVNVLTLTKKNVAGESQNSLTTGSIHIRKVRRPPNRDMVVWRRSRRPQMALHPRKVRTATPPPTKRDRQSMAVEVDVTQN